jgi:hypothetical protein
MNDQEALKTLLRWIERVFVALAAEALHHSGELVNLNSGSLISD